MIRLTTLFLLAAVGLAAGSITASGENTLSPRPFATPPQVLDKKSVEALVQELKDGLPDLIDDEEQVASITKKWDIRTGLVKRSETEILELLFDDVKAVVSDQEVLDTVWSDWTGTDEEADTETEITTKTDTEATKADSEEEETLDEDAVGEMLQELKDGLPDLIENDGDVSAITEKWNDRDDLEGKTKSEILELLFEDVKSVLGDSDTDTQDKIWAEWSGENETLDEEAVSDLLKELKDGLPKLLEYESDVDSIVEKWEVREDLADKTKKQILKLLFEDVRSVVENTEQQENVWSEWTGGNEIQDEEAVGSLLEELKDGLPDLIEDEDKVAAITEKWNSREGIVDVTKTQVLKLLFEDVVAVVDDKETQDKIWSEWTQAAETKDDAEAAGGSSGDEAIDEETADKAASDEETTDDSKTRRASRDETEDDSEFSDKRLRRRSCKLHPNLRRCKLGGDGTRNRVRPN